jgi:hypothetical protein
MRAMCITHAILNKIFVYACLPVGATALVEPWPPLQPVSKYLYM